MMVTHRELVAAQAIESLLQLDRLRDREVTRVGHAVELSLQQCLSRGPRKEGEGLREHQRKRRRQQAVEHPDDARGRVLLDSEHGAGTRGIRQPVRSEEHTSELQSPCNLVCRLLLEKKKRKHL